MKMCMCVVGYMGEWEDRSVCGWVGVVVCYDTLWFICSVKGIFYDLIISSR